MNIEPREITVRELAEDFGQMNPDKNGEVWEIFVGSQILTTQNVTKN